MQEQTKEVESEKAIEAKVWHLYLIRCRGGALYTGISTDVGRRYDEHLAGRGSRYLAGRRPLFLALSIPVGNRSRASRLEWLVKKSSARVKQDLVAGKTCLPDIESRQEKTVKKRNGANLKKSIKPKLPGWIYQDESSDL